MDVAEFDAWRGRYDAMTCADQREFYDRVRRDHPHQAGYNAGAYAAFLARAAARLTRLYVLELGGWTGGLAREMFARHPGIAVWCNAEICSLAAEQSEFQHPRYATWVPDGFLWEVPELPPANVLVASHFVEHVRRRDLLALLNNLPATLRLVGLQAPIAADTESADWTGYHGAHILEIGWRQVGAMLAGYGYEEAEPLRDVTGIGEFRAYER